MIAKASTICTYSLDPITLHTASQHQVFATIPALTKAGIVFLQSYPIHPPGSPERQILYFFLIVKEQPLLLLTKKTRTQRTAAPRYPVF